MTKTTTITINGRLYDAITGMPVATSTAKQPTASAPVVRQAAPKVPPRTFSDIGPRPQPKPIAQVAKPQPVATPQPVKHTAVHHPKPAAHTMHNRLKKSETLYRKALKKPEPVHHSASLSTADLPERSPLISRFGPNVTHHTHLTPKPEPVAEEPIAPAQLHPTVAKILQKQAPAEEEQLTGKALKEQLIKERLAQVDEAPAKPKTRWFARKPRLAAVLTSTLALLILGGYITYMNLPIISMQVAASRAGVNATMPGYHPDGYGLNGPITYAPGEVTINYKSTTNDNTFTLTQRPSTWDSQAVLDNFVTKHTETYLTFQERGIKVYTFSNKAAWVNGGLFYTIEGTANLSSDQVLRLATSM